MRPAQVGGADILPASWSYANIDEDAEDTISDSSGILHAVTINSPGEGATITLYDGDPPESREWGPFATNTIVNDNAVGNVAWTNPTNANTTNNVYATCSVGAGQSSNYLKFTNFG